MPKNNNIEINDEAKFELVRISPFLKQIKRCLKIFVFFYLQFVKFADNLFQSFNTMINPGSFGELSGSMFNWLEQMCSSNVIKIFI